MESSMPSQPDSVPVTCLGCYKVLEENQPKTGNGSWKYRAKYCIPCSKELAEQEAKEEAVKERKLKEMRLGLSPRFKPASFENFKEELQPVAFAAARGFVETYEPKKTVKGLYLFGRGGSGKTHLASAIGNALNDKEYVKFVSAPELLIDIKKTFNQARPDDTFDRLSHFRLLIIDDLGSEKPTEWVQETLFVLIDRRYTHFLPTIFTSNYALDDIKDRLGYRIASRIAEMCDMVELRPNDYRTLKK